ncbi:MAG: UDP-galactopyranose mutase [Clostridiales bacterium]|nr:UDP-galactopyranose mutase [Clostridiales bacterium]
MFDYIIVGAGLTGCILAERLANDNKRVLIIEKNDHIGGTCYDYYNEAGILIHKYGPHIFNTHDQEVWDYINKFSKFHIYHHRVLGVVEGKKVPIPFNLESLYQLFPKTYAEVIEKKLLSKYAINTKVPIMELLVQEDVDLKYLANYIYENVFLHYTEKQWGMTPDEVGSAAMARIPFYISRDDRYFQNKYQGIPKNGYTAIFKKMLSSKNISVMLNTNYRTILEVNEDKYNFRLFGNDFNGKVIFTGAVDELFDYKFGSLPYRTLNFVFETYNKEFYQEICTVNYPNNYDFTRITEFKYMTGQKSDMTTIVKEYPLQYNHMNSTLEPYYPIPKQENEDKYKKYLELSELYPALILAGRLANYKYYNMSETIKNALEVYKNL